MGARAVKETDNPSRIVAVGNYTLILMVIGIIAIAVGDELAIADPGGSTDLDVIVLIFGGPAIFLLSQMGFMRRATGRAPTSRILACLGLFVLAIATAPFTLLAAVAAATAVLVAVASADTRTEPESVGPKMAAP
jgi:low temperature requirement protein LtrA